VAGWGVTQPVASFTTYHAAGESRVTNIHRIADLLRGTLIEPHGTFSVNRTIGPRTRAKGFVEAGVIEQGSFTTSVGGGISQFATTLFNAAFFGGLDFVEYQSHSIYISRYPYGREATLSYPAPDLELSNPTDHGVLIWPTYTGSSITVTLWSTPTVTVEQTGQSEEAAGNCTRVNTERTRTSLASGQRRVDTVHATYRPGEGVDC
jgi:vancomycin resistance protein YoaR